MEPIVAVAWDQEPASRAALAWAADYVGRVGGQLVLVHVAVPMVAGGAEVPPVFVTEDDIAELQAHMVEAASAVGRKCTPVVSVSPSVVSGLVNACLEHRATLLCVGHGRGPIASFLLGSVAAEVVRKSPIPVLVTRAP